MDEINAMRMVRAGFLDVAIEIEGDLQVMLVDYFISEGRKIRVFWDCYEERSTLGPIVRRFKQVLAAEREVLAIQNDFSAEQVDALSVGLDELLRNRNIFAHAPMGQYFEVDTATNNVISQEWRIGRYQDNRPYFTLDTANEAYDKARACEDLVIRVRLPLQRAGRH